MLDPSHIPPVDDDELLARYVTQSGQFRKGDQSVKADLFMPHPHRELSVTRHRDATESEIWAVGKAVALSRKRLYGRADIQAMHCQVDDLRITAKPLLPQNPNHADIEGWPIEKADKKVLALRLADTASKLIPSPLEP
ncbi:MAG: hypothetical protein AAGL08_08720 [Cyanobacteria bacterium J06573_11]